MDVEETMKRINSHKGVLGIIIVNNDGIPIRTTFPDPAVTVQYAALVTHMASKARTVVRTLDPQNDLHVLRIRSKKHEIMGAPPARLPECHLPASTASSTTRANPSLI
jgi:dynein light chain roadblock-type